MERSGPVLLLVGALSTALAGCQYLPKFLDLSPRPASTKAVEPPPPAASDTPVAVLASVPVSAGMVAMPIMAARSRAAGLEADNARLKNELATALRENAKLKKDLATATDDNALLKDLAAKKQR